MKTRREVLKTALAGSIAAASGMIPGLRSQPQRISLDLDLDMVEGDRIEYATLAILDRAGNIVHKKPLSRVLTLFPGDQLNLTHQVHLYNEESLRDFRWQRDLLKRTRRRNDYA